MPAVPLARLKKQIADLTLNYTRPAEFVHDVDALLEYYGDHVFRTGMATQPAPLAPMYHTPPLVLRQLEMELAPLVQANPNATLKLTDALWQARHLETRLLAVILVGRLPASHSEQVVQRLQAWAAPQEERRLLDALIVQGTAGLIAHRPDALLSLIRTWLSSSDAAVMGLGLRALLPLIRDEEFENLPPIFAAVSPVLQSAAPAVQAELLEVTRALARRSPAETTFFLKQILSMAPAPAVTRMARKVLPELPPILQASLREYVIPRP